MQKTRVSIRIDQDLLTSLKEHATRNNITLTELIDFALRQINNKSEMKHSPLVAQITGTLPKNVSIEDYKKHLEEKYSH